MILTILAVVTATFQPAQPKVGDPIAIEFAAPVTLEASADYEIVSRRDKRVVVRTFQPKPFILRGTAGGVRFDNLVIPVHSVLRQGDDLKPAPLAPPRRVAYPRAPFLAIAIAAACAALVWAVVWWRSRRRVTAAPAAPLLTPDERFRRAVLALRQNEGHPLRWAALADETRRYLAATRPALGDELTTTELLERLREGERIVTEILRQGDLEKFSGRGAQPRDFGEVANHALELAS